MPETAIKHDRNTEEKQRIRDRYKGVELEELDVIPAAPQEDFYSESTTKRVAVYARVSTDDPRQTSSYELQKNHYTDMVSRRPDWDLVEIYADEGISGTSLQHRDAFVRMIADCKAGKIDLIVTKSVSRFARNIIDCIGYVRELKAMNPPIGVFFETENIFTLNANSEMSLSFIATLAQEESHSKSEIMNASIEMRFKRGIFLTPALLGYDRDEDGNLVLNEDEAKIVRLIFFLYLYGYTCQQIADTLTDLKCSTKRGNIKWSATSVIQILQNERHCGDVLARKTFTPNYLDHKAKKNRQDRNQYRMRDHHESIVSRDDYLAVQRMLRNARYGNRSLLPQLHVIPEGTLQGFVYVNPRWAGFTATDYLDACATAYEDGEYVDKLPSRVEVDSGDFDLRGYEVAHSQFFADKTRPGISFAKNKLNFSAAAIKKFPEIRHVELLLHPRKQLLAVRPVKKENPHSVQWSTTKDGKPKPRVVSAAAFMPTVFSLFGWNEEFGYKAGGTLKGEGKEQILIFDLSEAMALIPRSTILPDSVGKGRRGIPAYPPEWTKGFGEGFYVQETGDEFDASGGDWDISTPGQPYKEPDLDVTDPETIEAEIHQLIRELKEEDTNESETPTGSGDLHGGDLL